MEIARGPRCCCAASSARGSQGNALDSDPPAYSIDSRSALARARRLGLLALADQRLTEAADWFVSGARMVEAAYVADRVMSIDELLAAVQRTQGARRAGPPKPPDGEASEDACNFWEPAVGDHAYCWGTRLLEIYARRLLRVHRYDEALDAFADAAPAEAAKDFITAMKSADRSAGVERAEQLYRAARTLRTHGMEIAGTEVGPDWRMYDGAYERRLPCMPSPTGGYPRFAESTDEGEDEDERTTRAARTERTTEVTVWCPRAPTPRWCHRSRPRASPRARPRSTSATRIAT